jgi:hypothetical protein
MFNGVIEGLTSNALFSSFGVCLKLYLSKTIEIEFPKSQQLLQNQEPLGEAYAYPVRGTLKHLPKDHKIWLIVEEEKFGHIWPQGFFPVHFDEHSGKWHGKVSAGPGKRSGDIISIIAVVAPPTSQDLFKYFQKIVDDNKALVPLDRIPLECRHMTKVQAYVP